MKSDIQIRGYIVQGVSFTSEEWNYEETGDKTFSEQLAALSGDIVVEINSPGGSFSAGGVMYAALKAYKGKVTALLNGYVGSAATFPAMAADEVVIAPMTLFMIHNPSTFAYGDHRDMASAEEMLLEAGASMVDIYSAKTGKSAEEITQMMDDETTMNAKSAVEHGFADRILFDEQPIAAMFSRANAIRALSRRLDDNADTPAYTHSIPDWLISAKKRNIAPSALDDERVSILSACADIMNGL